MNALLPLAAFALGGGLGAAARHGVGRLVVHRFPLATLLVNVLGSLVLGAALASYGAAGGAGGETVERLVVGFCGGFTTFSSFAVQSLELGRERTAAHAAANAALNLGLCLGAFLLGAAIAR